MLNKYIKTTHIFGAVLTVFIATGGFVYAADLGSTNVTDVTTKFVGYHTADIEFSVEPNEKIRVYADAGINSYSEIRVYRYGKFKSVSTETDHIYLKNLKGDTLYKYRLVLENEDGLTQITEEGTFRTVSGKSSSGSSSSGTKISIKNATDDAVVLTRNATNVSGYSAILNGKVDGKGGSYYWFEYGTTDSLGKKTPEIGVAFTEDVNAYIDKLKPETLYHFRLVARNKFGVEYGNKFIFRTQGANVTDGQDGSTGSNGSTNGGNGGTTDSNGGGSGSGDQTTAVEERLVLEVVNNTTIIDGTIPAGQPVTAWFEYGTTNRLGQKTENQYFDGKQEYVFSDTLYNLEEDTTYYVQPVYEVDGEIIRGEMVSFSTSPNDKRGQNTGGSGGDSDDSFFSKLFGGNDSDSDSQSAAVAGSGDDFTSGGLAGLSKAQERQKRSIEKKFLGAFMEGDKYSWGAYLQERYFEVKGDTVAYGFPQEKNSQAYTQRAAASYGGTFLPNSLIEWLFLIIFLVILITVSRKLYVAHQKRQEELKEIKKLDERVGTGDAIID